MITTHLLYLHGFRSSPQSTKARILAQRIEQRHPDLTWWCPQLPPSPAAAISLISQGVQAWPVDSTVVIGSSLGGFYARCLARRIGCRSALLNPAVHPARDLARYIGEQTAWHAPAERFFFEPGFVGELQHLEGELQRHDREIPPAPGRQLAIIAQGDEVLDWREMQDFCSGGQIMLLPGSDHALSDFEEHIAPIWRFLGLPA